ncbi:uncharacterized protein LOC108204521 [Daucus carota subsp. sativus]|uniref:uncharacterized protein LOC108204521 n=1 Tax=Daucus carota subsp. sativus TaxID=79200 RepID=UPI0030831E72
MNLIQTLQILRRKMNPRASCSEEDSCSTCCQKWLCCSQEKADSSDDSDSEDESDDEDETPAKVAPKKATAVSSNGKDESEVVTLMMSQMTVTLMRRSQKLLHPKKLRALMRRVLKRIPMNLRMRQKSSQDTKAKGMCNTQ